MTEIVCSRYWNEKFGMKARTQLIKSFVWCSMCGFPNLCLGGSFPCWRVDCRNWRELATVGAGNSVDCNQLGSEGLKLCSSHRYVVSCGSVAACPFVLVNLETKRRDLRATEESERYSSLVAGGGGEAGMVCSGEGMSRSQLTGFLAAGWKLMFTERLEHKPEVQFNLWAGSCL
jgi:hypothetical protein